MLLVGKKDIRVKFMILFQKQKSNKYVYVENDLKTTKNQEKIKN